MIKVGLDDYIVKQNEDWVIINEKRKLIRAKVFKREFDLDNEPVDELIISFPECSIGSFLSINIDAQIIGIPLLSKKIKSHPMSLLMPTESKRVLPISEGEKQFITDFTITEDRIEFNTFRELKKYGNKIIMKKQAQ